MHGIIFLMTMHIAANTSGAKMGWQNFRFFRTSVLPSLSGTEKDATLKERLFGLGNGQGNRMGKTYELYYHLDNIPTHYYMEYLYKYPQQAFPYQQLIQENRLRSMQEPEFEILDTGVFDNDEYFDVLVTYAKQNSSDIFIRIDITNRFHKQADITLLPTLWFYNTWNDENEVKPDISLRNKIL
jgi:hypothetical protein